MNLEKNVFQCFQVKCGAAGNVLELWSAVQRLPLYEAAGYEKRGREFTEAGIEHIAMEKVL